MITEGLYVGGDFINGIGSKDEEGHPKPMLNIIIDPESKRVHIWGRHDGSLRIGYLSCSEKGGPSFVVGPPDSLEPEEKVNEDGIR